MSDGKADVKLLDDFDGQVKVEAPDFCIEGGAGGRNGSTTTYRRALVHGLGDQLTVAWDNDYRGGVDINGVAKVTGHAGTVGIT